MRKTGFCHFFAGIKHRYLALKFLLVCHLTLSICLTAATQQDDSQIKLFMSQLSDEDTAVRSKAAKKLGTFGHKAQVAVPLLIDSLNDESRYVRRNAAFALGRISENAGESVPALITALGDGDWTVRLNATSALGSIGENAKAAVPFLIDTIDDVNWEVSVNAVKSLGQIGSATSIAVSALSKALKSENEMICSNAAMALSEIGKAAIPVLIDALSDTNKTVRRTAAFSLGRIGKLPKEAVHVLKVTLNDNDISVRVSAAAALARIDPSSRIKTMLILTEALNSKDEFTRGFANYSLKKIRELDALAIEKRVKFLIQQLRDNDAAIRYKAIVTLGKMKQAAAGTVSDLIKMLDDSDKRVSSSVLEALKQIGNPEAIKAVNHYLENEKKPD
ncbi:TPA: HEAT repeat domain-containing protein [Candidatus Poribacteria bacterium]|nr:HEAT repeat domain-containing protein [Candidatus Poribacteria bacterium]